MYIPPFSALLQVSGLSKEKLNEKSAITLPLSVFKLLLRAAIESSDFDEDGYLQKNPDVRKAVRDGEVESGFSHYVEFGYFEGRNGGAGDVDPRWYAKIYSDIAAASKNGKTDYATEHFYSAGAAEGRSPNAKDEPDAARWHRAFEDFK